MDCVHAFVFAQLAAAFTAELYDTATGLFTRIGSLMTARSGRTATPISNGRILVAGGSDNDGTALASTEIYK